MSTFKHARQLRFLFAVGFALMFGVMHAPATAYGKPKKAKYGTIKILTTPGGLPLSVDGKPYGETTTDYRALDLEPGLHVIDITLPSGQRWTREIELPPGRIKCVALNYHPAPPVAKSPCPYPVIISAPGQVSEGEIVTYTSDLTYGGSASLHYTWKVSPANARIISGAGTPTITVDSTGLAGQRITAVLVVDDGSGDTVCRQTAQAFTFVPAHEKRAIEGREYDTCSNCKFDDQKARLDNLAVELQGDPTTTTYIFAYGGRTSPVGQADRLLARSRDYLVSQRGIDASRIILSNGGFREEDAVEIWLVPRGATPPRPSPTIQAGDARPSPAPSSAPTRRRRG
ncbi:MAG TPA: hypothetical protein VKB46_16515 [Pyrinomonadaceae bacterium]|nr:hypothetical protein [Pyrinomonadaceae bacterium]